MKNRSRLPFVTAALLFASALSLSAQTSLQSPAEYLGYELGEQWTPHHRVIAYFKHVAGQSVMAEWERYGTTYEGRELIITRVSTEENIAASEQIRTDNLKRAGILQGSPVGDKIAIVWLSYNIHGNETSSSEAAMKTLYELVRPGNAEVRKWLSNTMVILDPMVNPDGRDRYVHWYKETAGDEVNVHIDAREHHEPWPGGRTNHYYFDLNRDWAWLIQKESRQRIEVYQSWLPHIHVDYHEQGYTAPYYFAPAAEPFHKAITEWQREFQYTIGKNHTRYFDKNNWLYFTREIFDLFYPSYGDTYPIFNGAIGMTYEQAGHSTAGLGIVKPEGDTLTLHDRLIHHHTTGLSTVEVTSKHAEQVVDQFATYYRDAVNNPDGEYKTYVIKGDNDPDKLRELFELLDRHKVRYGRAPRERTFSGYEYRTGSVRQVRVEEEDYIVSAYQPKSVMARILFEPQPELTDSLTYDITAWSQHYAFGLDGYALTERIDPVESGAPSPPAGSVKTATATGNGIGSESPYAYLAEWKTKADMQLLARLLRQGINVRFASRPFMAEGRTWQPGTLVITRSDNG
ncbi:MAG: M14 family zinc carboxypeptidase, partial [Balneolaceae bacterium]|nr:M14 family zinc carboxypeptidase [Balneolaceae bacterium]